MKLEEEIGGFQKEIKERKQKMKTLTDSLIQVMKTNQIECFDIKGGCLLYKKNKSKKAINGKTLLQLLNDYYKNTKEAENVTKYILENREEVFKEVIRHKIDK
jgi:hypothetical protein